ncbi:MAG: hypothetical protein MUE96_00380 [Bacteroidia bacterium]|jgi:hypothetical protein|nr:hypothetical protein [Bacteroidia bacterium]
MKNLKGVFACSTVLSMLVFVGCSKNPEQNKASEVKVASKQTLGVSGVPVQEAINAIRNYGNWWRAQPNSGGYINRVTRSFLIPGGDLINVLQPSTDSTIIDYCQYKQARAYLGLDSNNTIHLYLTPVNDEGQDVIIINSEGREIVFDLTQPCPQVCDESSQLYQAFGN